MAQWNKYLYCSEGKLGTKVKVGNEQEDGRWEDSDDDFNVNDYDDEEDDDDDDSDDENDEDKEGRRSQGEQSIRRRGGNIQRSREQSILKWNKYPHFSDPLAHLSLKYVRF